MLYHAVPVLDHGFVRVIDYMGDDAAVVQAARVSYGRGTKRVSEDAGLIRYLMRHRHSTPFEMCEIKYHVKLPIFVARQWIRHRTANVNEYSARYSVMDREFYIPAPEHLAAQSASNRQGRGAVLEGEEAAAVLDLLRSDAGRAHDNYSWMLNEDAADPARQGLARELARMNLTLNTYTQWYWKTDLHNLLGFLQPARGRPCAIRDPRLCRRHAAERAGLGAGDVRRVPRLPHGRGHALGRDAGGGEAAAGRRGGGPGGQRAEQARVGGAGGRAGVILVFGSVNLDVIHHLAALPRPGQTVTGRSARMEAGGKGANQAVAAALDGAQVAFAGAVGQDGAAPIALAGLQRAGVDLSRLARVDRQTGTASVCVDREGHNQIAVGSGANLLARADQVADADLGPHVTLVLQMEVEPAQTAALIRRARARGARIVLNLAPAAPIAADALRMVDWLVANLDEAAWLGESVGAAADAAALHAAFGVGVVRTRGGQGMDAADAAGTLRVAALPLDVADTTGAGDCFTGVFAAALDRGVGLAEALRRGNVAAGLSCMREGSQCGFPHRSEVDAALPGSPEAAVRQAGV